MDSIDQIFNEITLSIDDISFLGIKSEGSESLGPGWIRKEYLTYLKTK